jgi:HEAT repeat protein
MPVAAALIGFLAGAFVWPGSADPAGREIVAREDAQRLRAVLLLAAEDPARARPPLAAALRDRDPAVRTVAARLLLRRGGAAEAVEAATAWLSSTAPRERLAGLQVLRDADELPAASRRAVERALRDGDVATRTQALEVLAAHGAGASLAPLLGALDDEQRDVRARAARALGPTRDARAALPLLARVSDGDRQVQTQAVQALGALGDRRAVPALVRLLGESSAELRAAVIDALGRLGDPAAVPALSALARRGPLDDSARRALGEIGSPEAVDALLALAREAPAAPDLRGALALAGGRAVPRLIAELSGGTSASASLAADVLGRAGDRRATPALVSALERRPPVAPAALAALSRLGDPASVPGLVRVAASADVAERRALALDALAAIGDDRALVALPRALADGDRGVRVAGLRLAAALAGAGLVSDVAARLRDPDAGVRREAALALARLPAAEPPAGGVVAAILDALARVPATDDVTARALGDALERQAGAAALSDVDRAYLGARGAARAALARGLAAAHAAAPLSSAPVVEALLRDLGGPAELALVAADALAGARLSDAQASTLEAAAARAEDTLRARLFPALARGPGVAQVVSALRDPQAGPALRAAAAWALAGAPAARPALGEAARADEAPVAANARAALAASAGRRSWSAARVVTVDGVPVVGRWVIVTPPGGAPVWAVTDLEGRARVGGLPDGAPLFRLAAE